MITYLFVLVILRLCATLVGLVALIKIGEWAGNIIRDIITERRRNKRNFRWERRDR